VAELSPWSTYDVPITTQSLQYVGAADGGCTTFLVAHVVSFTAPIDSWYVFYTSVSGDAGDNSVLEIRRDNCAGDVLACNDDVESMDTGLDLDPYSSYINTTLSQGESVYVLVSSYAGFKSSTIPLRIITGVTSVPTASPSPQNSSPTPKRTSRGAKLGADVFGAVSLMSVITLVLL
jgi:hypothetical protein